MISYILAKNTVTVMVDNKAKIFNAQDKVWSAVIEALRNNDEPALIALVNRPETIKSYAAVGNIEFKNGTIHYKGQPLHETICDRMVAMHDEGFSIRHLMLFLDNLMENPSNSAIQELYEFLAACNLPITNHGTFLAYKRVREDYTDVYSGKISNRPGLHISMDRHRVDDRRDVTCSHGLHVCSLQYLQHFNGERLILVEVNPRDVVSVPNDYHNTKMRVCEYYTVKELPLETIQEFNDNLQAVAVMTGAQDYDNLPEDDESYPQGDEGYDYDDMT